MLNETPSTARKLRPSEMKSNVSSRISSNGFCRASVTNSRLACHVQGLFQARVVAHGRKADYAEALLKCSLSGRELNGNLVLGGILAQYKLHSFKVMPFAKGHSFIEPVKLVAVLEEFRFASVAFDEHFRVTAS